jgi:hypothetical protein
LGIPPSKSKNEWWGDLGPPEYLATGKSSL